MFFIEIDSVIIFRAIISQNHEHQPFKIDEGQNPKGEISNNSPSSLIKESRRDKNS